jgi:ribonuclease HI
MELESALLPPIVRLNHNSRRYIVRALKLSPKHPIKAIIDNIYYKINSSLLENSESDSSESNFTTTSRPTKFKPDTSLEGLLYSIYSLFDIEDLEPIKHFYFSPWGRIVPYSIQISSKPKIEEAKEHLKYINTIKGTQTTSIYTDGSQTQEGHGIGLGFTVYNYNRPSILPIYSRYSNIGDQAIVYNGELEAVAQALEYASDIALEGDAFNVFTDNQAGLLRLKTPSDKPGQSQQIRAIQATNIIINKGASINLVWVPGHTDIIGNEEADRLAKLGTKAIEDLISNTSFAYLEIKINQLKKQEILEIASAFKSKSLNSYSCIYSWKVQNKILIPRNTKRVLASSFYQLKLGHGYLKSYLYRLGIIEDNKCRCGLVETAKHLIRDCSLYRAERKALYKKIKNKLGVKEVTLPILLHTRFGIEHLLVFLKETNICSKN